MKGVTISALSQRGTRRNCSTSEDAGYPQKDGKTPWSFTVAWYWITLCRVENRWEALKQARQGLWSHSWNTTHDRDVVLTMTVIRPWNSIRWAV
jgi:hypothetical protein